MRRVYFFLSTIIFLPVLLNAYDWPIKKGNVQHVIISTLGEWRSGHFHAGVDINAPCSTKVYTIEGDTCYIDRVNGYGSGINIGHFRYYHMVIRDTIQDSTWVGSDSLFAKTDGENHVHLQEADRRLTAPGASANNAKWLNLLRDGAMTPYVDSTNPRIDSIKFYRQGTNNQLVGILDGKVDVLAVAGDTRTDSTGHSAGGNVSLYRIGYEVKNTLGSVIKSYWEKIKFDTIPDPTNSSQLSLTYGSGSTMAHFRYWVSNDPFNPDENLRNWYWNTKQKLGQPDSVDADSIEDAKFKDGFFWVKVIAADIRNNADSESVKVLVANFRPRVKQTDPVNGQVNVPLNRHIYVKFSEPIDQNVSLHQAITISPGVSGDWVWISDKEIEFTPDPSFVENTTYTVSLSSQLKDLQGQELIPYNFSFTTGTSPGPQCYPTRFQWEDVTSWDVCVSWFDYSYAFQLFGYFSFPFYGSAYDMIIFNRRGSIWFDTNRDWCHFDLPTAGGSGQPVMAVYNDSLRHLFGHYSLGCSVERFNPNREVVRWTYTYYADTTEFEAELFGDGTIRFYYRKCDIDIFDNDGGSGISKGDGIKYSSITANYGPVYELAPAAFIFTTDPPPGKPRDPNASWPIRAEFVYLFWRQNPEPDLAGYNVYRRHSDSLSYVKLGSTAVNNYTDTLIQLGNTYIYRITAFDTLDLESAYSDSVIVRYGPREVDNQLATAYNNASRIIRNPSTGEIILAYTSGDSILFISSFDEGVTWSHDEVIALGQFPALVLDSEHNPCCLFGRWIGPSGFGSAQLYYTKYIDGHWTTPALLMSVDSVYIGIPRYAIPAPSANIDPHDTIHVTWMSPMGQEYPHRFAVWYGNLYALDTIPAFNYVQLDTIWVYESSPCPSLAIDGSQNIHVVYETDPAAPTLFYRYRESGVWREKEIIESGGCYYPDLEFFGDRVHLVWDYRYPDTTVAHELHYCSKSIAGWDTIINVYEPLPFNVFGEPVNVGGWYTIWANQDIYYSRFNGTYWEEPETVRVTAEISAHPTALFRQDMNDTCLYIAWTEGDSAPYSIQFKKIIVRSVPKYYSNLGKPVQSPYCIHRDGYWIFGEKPYESVDYGKDSLVYKFTDLDTAKKYRIDLSYYFKPKPLKTQGKSDLQHTENTKKQHNIVPVYSDDEKQIPTDNQKGIGRLIQELVVDGISLDTSFITPHKLVRVSIWLPEQTYADGEIIGIIKKVKGKVVVCGEISLYEFNSQTKESLPETAGGPQSQSEQSILRPFFFDRIYPNPTKEVLKIRFNSPDERLVSIKLYDVVGRALKTIFEGKAKIGMNEYVILQQGLAAGVYFVRLESEDYRKTEKVILLR